jgi:3'-phosphoadenosine 5'-phosphosulfate sulfotransferase (PAPS reductase)/FAD synthetase
MDKWQLNQRQSLPLALKIQMSLERIKEFYLACEGKVYIGYSGGKDSEVLLHLIRTKYPEVKAVFCDTGTELETRDHAIKKANIVLHPKKTMLEVWNNYGIPFPNKQQANYIYKLKHSNSAYLKDRLLTGKMKDGKDTKFKVRKKWLPILELDVEVSDTCCHYLKKEPFRRYNKLSGEKPYIATMASDGMEREKHYLKNGCINFDKGVCTPLGFWTEQDILQYITENKLDYCPAYGDIKCSEGKYHTTLAKRTGCVGCLFGISLERSEERRVGHEC